VLRRAEWLEADGLGGFASGTACGVRSRRYHAILLVATEPPAGRIVLVNGFEAWLEGERGTLALTSQHYAPDVIHPDGSERIESFEPDPWPSWVFRLPDGSRIEHGLLVQPGRAATVLYWRLREGPGGMLAVRPLLSGRDYHALHRENPAFRFDVETSGGDRVVWRPYPGLPAVVARSNGTYAHQPHWYRSFLYAEERARGLDCVEDLASPGVLRWDLRRGEAVLWLAAEGQEAAEDLAPLRAAEGRRRRRFPSRLHRAADAYLVRRGSGKTIVAGYPWFTDWGRDTFIALRGLCLATGRLEDARAILLEWAGAVSEGMLPNRFPDHGEQPEFNAVDAALWYVVAVHEFLEATERVTQRDRRALETAIEAILSGYARGTRYGIRADDDGLLAAGEPGLQLTWMDAKVGDWVVTPRIGKPVEVQALWLNALRIGSALSERWAGVYARGRTAFETRFWDEAADGLYDVVDVDHRPGTADAAFRPNQIFAVGGLPFAVLDGERARRVVDSVERRLLTPLGLRSLAPDEPGYAPRYEGGVRERDGAYHQGTVWPWLMGPFVEAWVRVRGGAAEAKREARARFLAPLLEHLDGAGLGHLPEIADAAAPHAPRGCPFQAWSVGEALRLDQVVLAPTAG
jgi:predicted glycogen debranching enzyme